MESRFKFTYNKDHRVYYPQILTKNLIEFDIQRNSLVVHELENYSPTPFFHASLCVLPDGAVFISCVSFRRNFESACLIYRPQLQDCLKLPKLKKELKSTSLIFYKDSVYAIAGFEVPFNLTRYVQRFDFYLNRWTILKPINHPRFSSSLVLNSDKIAIFGCGVSTIEEYNPITQKSTDIIVNYLNTFLVAYLHEDNIYILQANEFLILGRDYQLRDTINSNKEGSVISCSNTVFHKGKVYYYNNQENLIEILDTSTGRIN
jgi:hypothetical protein